MTCEEFSNEFDILYNNVMSNQAPGLDEYEKSVFLTRAQDDIVKRYFTPKGNKDFEGFDSSLKRNVDFSTLYRKYIYKYLSDSEVNKLANGITRYLIGYLKKIKELGKLITETSDQDVNAKGDADVNNVHYHLDTTKRTLFLKIPTKEVVESAFNYAGNGVVTEVLYLGMYIGSTDEDVGYTNFNEVLASDTIEKNGRLSNKIKKTLLHSFELDSDTEYFVRFIPYWTTENYNNNIIIPYAKGTDIFIPINDQVKVNDTVFNKDRLLQIVPLTSTEYIRVMSKPFKNPPKNQVWKVQNEADNNTTSLVLIFGYNNIFKEYQLRYLAHPTPIILTDLTKAGLSINGQKTQQTCALSAEIHSEILQRAVELAKAAYTGDLSSTIQIGNISSTNLGQGVDPQQTQRAR